MSPASRIVWKGVTIDVAAPALWQPAIKKLTGASESIPAMGPLADARGAALQPDVAVELVDQPLESSPVEMTIAGRTVRGEFLDEDRIWKLRLSCRGHRPLGPLLEYALERARMVEWVGRGGVHLHGCGVASHGAARLFLGPSGSGKTTLARKYVGQTILSDEWLWLEPGGNSVRGEEVEGRTYRVEAVFFIAHGPRFRMKTIPVSEAVARLMANQFSVAPVEQLLQRTMDSLQQLAGRTPAYRLETRLVDDVRALLDTALVKR
ncbi:MAG: hypothetical protein ACR2L2_02670 [Acidobacteriota bacterium]